MEDVELTVLSLAFFSRQTPASEFKLLTNEVTLRAKPRFDILYSWLSVGYVFVKNDDCQVIVNGGPDVIEVPAVIDSDLLDVVPFELSFLSTGNFDSGIAGQVVCVPIFSHTMRCCECHTRRDHCSWAETSSWKPTKGSWVPVWRYSDLVFSTIWVDDPGFNVTLVAAIEINRSGLDCLCRSNQGYCW